MAASSRNGTSIEGSLYDLVARGVKDVYFIKDEKESINPFDWRYERYPAALPEIRWTNPLNDARFGQRVEWEFDLPADVLLESHLVIDLPSWLPPEFATGNMTSLTYANGTPGSYYGYTNGVGYFLFEKIQIFQDTFLLQEVTGDSLYAAALTKGSWNQSFLTQQLAGIHNGSPTSIMHNATPGRLEIPIPMIGSTWQGDKGLPLCGMRQTVFRLRCQLRPLERLVETTGEEQNPAPWLHTFTQNGITAPAVTRSQIGQPTITLRTKQLYLLNEDRQELAKQTVEIPYIRYYDTNNVFTINALDYLPLGKGGTATITRFLDANFTVERIVNYFRDSQAIAQNRLWNFRNSFMASGGQFYTTIQLTIAGQERESPWTFDVWQHTVTDAQEERSPSQPISVLNWSRGWRIEDVPPARREPTGGINFTTADRPMLSIGLRDIPLDPVLGIKQSVLVSVCESWAVYVIRNGSGGLAYAN